MSQKFKILMVDDDKETVDAMEHYINKHYDATIHKALDGNEAVKMASNQDYDIVLLDVKMPALNGIEVLKKIRERDQRVHVIMITSWHSADVLNETMQAGANAFLVKPAKPEVLKSRIDIALKSLMT